MAGIPGLDGVVTTDVLTASARFHNQFPEDTVQPPDDVLTNAIKDLRQIIAKYKVQDVFQLRLIHRHFLIPEDHVLLGLHTAEPSGHWVAPTPIGDVCLSDIHGYVFSVDTEGHLFPSEFRRGSFDRDIDLDFFQEFVENIQRDGLEHILGLQIIEEHNTSMVEFAFNFGNLLLRAQDVRPMRHLKFRTTGWMVTVKNGTVDSTGEQRCFYYEKQGHVRVIDTKARTLLSVIEALRKDGLLIA
ncbi:MAG: hypothetical protein M1822_009067 [Bathelium mastoideum]|nr:MAG: hypothetical protein M1822_009067 [Bathelium mastoideum]